MSTLLLFTTATLAARAAAPPPPPAPALPVDAAATLVDAAAALVAQGELEAARATVDEALRQPLPADPQARAEALRADLPLSRSQLGAMTRLAVGQAVMGSYLLGPHMARISYDPMRSATPYYLGALGGAALGAGTGIWMGTRQGFDLGEANTMLTAEVLGGLTGATAGLLADPWDQKGPAWGTLVGVGAGAGLGVALSTRDPSPTTAFAAQSGALWGAGLATAGIVFTEGADQPEGALLPLAIGADAGAVIGALLARPLGLTTRQLAFADLGLGLGTGAGLLVVGIVAADDEVSPQAGSLLVTATGLTGGLLTAFLVDPDRADRADRPGLPVAHALLSGHPGDVALALPLPTLAPTSAGPDVDVQLVDYRF